MRHNFNQKTALVMGGNSGIGKATAQQLLEGGATVCIVGRNADKMSQAIDGLSALGAVQGWVYDITDAAQLNQLCQRIATDLPTIDYLVNASGVFGPKPFIDHTLADYDSYLNISRGLYFVTQQVAKNLLAAQKPGAIVNIGSMWAHQAVAATPSSAYSMASSTKTMKTFILVHGSWHSAWNWHRIVPILEKAGHTALAIEPTIYREGLYHDCDDYITELAKLLLSAEPVESGLTPLQLTDEKDVHRTPLRTGVQPAHKSFAIF
jgi:hypothetical protein